MRIGWLRLLTAVLLLVTVAGACSENNKVGDESLLNVEDQANKTRLGETTTTAPPVTGPTTTAVLGVGGKATTTTTAAPRQAVATTRPQEQAVTITINSDNSNAPQFDPPAASVYVNGLVRWTNADSKPRSVVAGNNAFRSPDIAPGASWDFRPSTTGTFQYQDGTRPYANGTLQVANR